jgi:ribosomal protein S18 acetylase RimI-like enzyme
MITYQLNPTLTTADFIDILERSTLGIRRPLQDAVAMEQMFRYGNVYVGAFDGKILVGLARVMTDFVYTSYLSDLAVDVAYQKQGIGKTLIQEVQRATPKAKIILVSAPAAEGYYPKIGMKHHAHCYQLAPGDDLVQNG